MAETKASAGRASGMNIDTKLVRELADMLAETGLTEIAVEDGDRKIKVSRGGAPAAIAHSMPAPQPAPAAASPAADPPPAAPSNGDAVKSPMVGTVFLSPEPGAAPFVNVGDQVKAGDTLVIVEAMKVMNPITAAKPGAVLEILVDNAQPVEYDQPLVVIG